MGALNTIKQSISRWFSRQPVAADPSIKIEKRIYHMAKQSRLTMGFGTSITSEDTELASSLRVGRSRSRQLVRDSAYARRGKAIIVNNIVGAGIGLQAQVMTTRNELNTRVNDEIERVWKRWSRKDSCHTGQALCFEDIERVIMGQAFEAGEIFVRKYFAPFGASKVPYALELIESERIADELAPSGFDPANNVRLGVQVNEFGAAIAYMIRTLHPGELRLTAEQTTKVEKVPASSILHIRIIDRWPQTRAMPWMATVARKLNDMDGLSEAEIVAARGAANYMGIVEMPDGSRAFGTIEEDGSEQEELEPGLIMKLKQGEKFTSFMPNRPNTELDPFMRMMLREVAAGIGCSYESISKDYSQSNYSASRLALIDDRDLWKTFQQWFVRDFRAIVHREWLQQAVLAGQLPSISIAEYGSNPEKFEAARFKCRGWGWINPKEEVTAAVDAVKAGFRTVSEVIEETGSGRDVEDVITERKAELEMFKTAGILTETDPRVIEIPDAPMTSATVNAPPPTPVVQPKTTKTDPAKKAVEMAESIARGD